MKKAAIILLFLYAIVLISCSGSKKGIGIAATNSITNPRPTYQIPSIESKKTEGCFSNIDPRFVGVYLPRDYIESIIKSKNHSATIHATNAKYRSFLLVQNLIIYSNVLWHEQYAIKNEEGQKFKFDSDAATIKDENGYYYDRISQDVNNGYSIIEKFIVEKIFDNVHESSGISISGNIVKINSVEFVPYLDDMFFPKTDNLILKSENGGTVIGLIIEDKKYKFVKIKSIDNEPGSINSDEVYFEMEIGST